MIDILIVEDEAPIREWIVYTVKNISEEFNVVASANNGEVGYELAVKLKPKVIITDIKMPIMDGIEFTKKIKNVNPDVIIIILTNFAEFNYAKEAITCGVYEYLIKSEIRPKELKELLIKINDEVKLKIEKEQKYKEIEILKNNDKTMIEDKFKFKYSKAIDRAIEYMEKNYNNHISLTDVSKHVYLSPEYFSRLFKEEVGENFVSYLTIYRMNKAFKLIKNTRMKISQIAREVGYSDAAYFSKTYKKYKGISPEDDRY